MLTITTNEYFEAIHEDSERFKVYEFTPWELYNDYWLIRDLVLEERSTGDLYLTWEQKSNDDDGSRKLDDDMLKLHRTRQVAKTTYEWVVTE